MVVCKFFLQGECRFGESCRFEHQMSSERSGNQQFGNMQQQNKIVNPKTGAEIDLNILLNSVKNDVVSGEKGKQWLLSCYAPFKEKPPFPGFIDMSFEEVRFGFLEAQKSNSLEQYNQKLQQMLTEAKVRYKALENPTQEIVTLLTNIYNNNLNSGNSTMISMNQQEKGGLKGLFGLSNSSVFSQSPQNSVGNSNSIFGQRNTLQNNLVQQNSVFGQPSASANTGSVFGQPSASVNTGSVFGQPSASANTGSVFGQPQNPPNVFQQASMNRSSIFGQKTGSVFGQQQTGASIFGQQNSGSMFGQQNSGSVFGQQTPQSSNVFGRPAQSGTNVFGQANSSGSIFGQNNPNSMITQQTSAQTVGGTFGQPNTGNVFGQQSTAQNSGSIFGQQNTNQNNAGSIFGAQKNTTSIFGQQNTAPNAGNMMDAQSTGNIFGQPTPVQSGGSIFGQNANQNGNSIFQSKPQPGNSQQTNVFGGQNENQLKTNTQGGVFGNMQQASPFQQAQQQNPQPGSIFGKIAEPSNQSVFGQKTTQSNSIFGPNSTNAVQDALGGSKPSSDKIKWGAYSKIEDLSEEEIKWFNSDTFDIDSIPDKPPTYEMCF